MLETRVGSQGDLDDGEIVAALDALRVGRYDHSITGCGAVAEALRALAHTLEGQAHDQLRRTVALSGRASESMAATSFLTGDVRETAENAQTIASAVGQLDAAMQDIAETGGFITQTARQVEQSAEAGLAAVDRAAASVDDLARVEREATGRIEQLVETSMEIGKMVNTIQAIAKQTNFLAMNATIEAARAGEAGRGFNIVAGEVKNLANQTARATDDIRNRITAIQNEVRTIRDILLRTAQVASDGMDSITHVRDQMTGIVGDMRGLDMRLDSHAASLTEQSAATQEVARSLDVIREKTERARQNAERAVESVAASEQVIQQEFQDLGQRHIPDAVLQLAQSDHLLWKKRLAQMLVGKSGLTETEVTDHRSCRLGKWYYGDSSACYHQHPAFVGLEAPHARVHDAARDIVRLFNAGDRLGAMACYETLEAASAQVLDGLDRLGGDGRF